MRSKTARATVSFPGDLMQVAQGHCEERGWKFSNYIERLVRADLTSEGKLSADEVNAALARVRELINSRGLPAVQAKLDEFAMEEVGRG